MSECTGKDALASDADDILDQLLEDWSEQVWNTFKTQESVVLQDVIILAEDLGYAWWSRFIDHIPFHSSKAV
ncbi:hypothetical protein GZH47_02530 [Paenibacillus rhizovicinus]|uniref:Uncharacterized protein n=1 Tax=Paenibacillus rhizovicinus TaxID=2704463 RepID=A0A6C0NUI7_9BACL|nr:hypothetical protein [Paenibacillus rhizovicinus]QHW29818.1 hypothetical protein GZH47_02530 [Paenibacillus rhizovicinus]